MCVAPPGLNALHSIEVNHQRKNAVQIIHWLQRAKAEHASREEVRRFFTGGDRSEGADWFTHSPRSDDTWTIKVEYDADGRVKDVEIDGRTPSEMAELYRPR